MKKISREEWLKNEKLADVVNHSPAVNGILTRKCERCGVEWTSPEEIDYDRTKDGQNWPVLCDECQAETRNECKMT